MKNTILPVATAAILLLTHGLAEALQISVRIRDSYDEAHETTLSAHNGFVGTAGSATGHGIEYGEPVWIPDGIDPDGNETGYYETPELYRWTDYTIYAPDDWSAKSVCFSVDGTQWSALHLLLNTAGFEFWSSDVGANPFSGTATDPSSNVSVLGNILPVGKWWNDADKAVFTITAWDNAVPSWPAVGMDFVGSAANTFWRWMHYPGYVAMELDHLHRLTVRRPGIGVQQTVGRIVIDPTLSRILIDNSPVLTTTSAASQFVSKNASGVSLAYGGLVHAQPGLQPQVVLGKFNDDRIDVQGTDKTKGVLVVGTGTGSGNEPRKNGLRILDDGTVLIWPKADLPMHTDFQKGPRP